MPYPDRRRAFLRLPAYLLRGGMWLFASLLFGGCQSGPVPAAEFVAQADRLHEQVFAATVNPNRDLNEYFADVGRRVVEGAQEASGGKFRDPVFANMQFHLVGSGVPNALTTGGRHIYIYNAVLQLCQGEEELAAVMAHEFAHAVDLDVQKSGMTPDPRDASSPDRAVYSFALNPLSPGVEQEADARAFSFYVQAGWDPAGFARIFDALAAQEGQAVGGRGIPGTPGVPAAARAAAARGLAQNLPAGARKWRKANVADAQTFKELQAAGNGMTERSAPLNGGWLYLRAFPTCLLQNDLPAQRDAQQDLRRRLTPTVQPTPLEAS